MTYIRKHKPSKPSRRTKKASKDKSLILDNYVLDRSLPQVQVRVLPSRKKSGNKPSDQMVIELQCEV